MNQSVSESIVVELNGGRYKWDSSGECGRWVCIGGQNSSVLASRGHYRGVCREVHYDLIRKAVEEGIPRETFRSISEMIEQRKEEEKERNLRMKEFRKRYKEAGLGGSVGKRNRGGRSVRLIPL